MFCLICWDKSGRKHERPWACLRVQLRPAATRGRRSPVAAPLPYSAATLWSECHFRSQSSYFFTEPLTQNHKVVRPLTWMIGGNLTHSLFFTHALKKKSFMWLLCGCSAALLCRVNSNNKLRSPLIFAVVAPYLWALILSQNPARPIYSPNSEPILAHVRCKFEVGRKLERFWQRKGV